MDSDDETYDAFNESQELDVEICGKKNSSFEALTTTDITKLMNQYIDDVKSIVQLPRTTIRILLSYTKWDKYELLAKVTDESKKSRAAFFAKANVTDPLTNKKMPHKSSKKKVECTICFSEFIQKQTLDLGCGHEYCEGCWRQYLTIKITDDGDAEAISCPAEKCGIIVDDETIMQMISDKNVRQKYQHLMTNSFVMFNHQLRWCPSPTCDLAIKANQLLAYQQKCTCVCGFSFCFNCGADFHDPISCSLIEKWLKDNNDETVLYITKYTKGCPKCKSLIEKNGGCNHMTCGKCRHEFCWLCFGDWKTHKSCNSFKEEGGNENDKKRWEHYLKQYALHKKSLQLEKGLMEDTNIKEKIQSFQDNGLSWHEAQFYTKAVQTLCESRQQLMYMCIFGYFVKSNNQKEIFEMNQHELLVVTEALSRYLEQEITSDNVDNIMLNLNDKVRFCERRHNDMKEHIYEGFERNWWKFNKNI